MKALITNAEIIHAVRTHFGIAESVDITFSHVGGLDGICAVVDQSPILGTDQVNAVSAAIGTGTTEAPKQTEAPAEEKQKRARRTFKKDVVEEEAKAESQDTSEGETEAADAPEETTTKTTKRRFGKAAQAEPAEDTDQSESEPGEDEGETEAEAEAVVETKTTKRRFGKAAEKAAPAATEDEDEGVEEETKVTETKPKFGARKTVFGNRK